MKTKTCTLLFLRRDDQILLAMKKRGFGANLWNGVGGKVDPGETIEQALVRECQEEIGVTPLSFSKVAEHDFLNDAATEPWQQLVHVYMCDAWEGEPTESEEMAPAWFALGDIPYNKMWQDDQMWLPLVLKGKNVSCTFGFDEHDEILSATLTVVTSFDKTQA
jgi:mutator protein MutT